MVKKFIQSKKGMLFLFPNFTVFISIQMVLIFR